MSNLVLRDHMRRLLMAKYELQRTQYKAICEDRNLPNTVRYEYRVKLSQLPRNSSKTRIRNRCTLTGRSRSVYKRFRISRIVFRELASQGAICGVYKSSW
uniref:Small ribosomal subunit protein uS14m n=1 Tax=Zygnema circumcarinatum TaxID=35869 RepID=A0A6N0GXL0_ZYGCR|nr:ribosomal protein S14 [Zygnema circumcarinatum]QKQ14721.1 ribosomal protein S14 [Zygnema circumcarinatum]WEL36365.1 ribosomal protein S14 [Zygnema circumcarinatum]